MANLYEIGKVILECINFETGEIDDVEKLEALDIERSKKIENTALYIKNKLSEAAAYKAEKDSFAQREKAAKNEAERLKRYLDSSLQGEKFQSTKAVISYRKSVVVECEDIEKVDKLFLRFEDPKLDKSAVKDAIKGGQEVAGCSLVEKQNIQIK